MIYMLIHHAFQCTKCSYHLKLNTNLNLVLHGSCNSISRKNEGYLWNNKIGLGTSWSRCCWLLCHIAMDTTPRQIYYKYSSHLHIISTLLGLISRPQFIVWCQASFLIDHLFLSYSLPITISIMIRFDNFQACI